MFVFKSQESVRLQISLALFYFSTIANFIFCRWFLLRPQSGFSHLSYLSAIQTKQKQNKKRLFYLYIGLSVVLYLKKWVKKNNNFFCALFFSWVNCNCFRVQLILDEICFLPSVVVFVCSLVHSFKKKTLVLNSELSFSLSLTFFFFILYSFQSYSFIQSFFVFRLFRFVSFQLELFYF